MYLSMKNKFVRIHGKLMSVSPRSNPSTKKQKGQWFEKHGKSVATGTLVVGGVAVVGIGLYFLYESLSSALGGGGGTGGQNTPYCNQLESQLASLYTQIGNYNTQALRNGGTYSTTAQAAIVNLQGQIATVSSSIASQCSTPITPGIGADISTFLQNTGWAFVLAVGAVLGVAVAYVAVRSYLSLRVYSKKLGKGNLPESLDDVEVGDFNPATVGQLIAQAQGIADVENGTMSAQDVADTLRTLAANDPVTASGVSDSLSTYFNDLAADAATADEAAVFSDIADLFEDAAAGDAAALDDALDAIAGL
jgi:hypothetical protein